MDVDKQRLVDAFKRREDYLQLAQQLNIKRTTAYATVRRAKENNGQVSKPRGGFRGRRLSQQMIEVAITIAEENNVLTLQQINEELRRRLPRICITTLSRSLYGHFYRLRPSLRSEIASVLRMRGT